MDTGAKQLENAAIAGVRIRDEGWICGERPINEEIDVEGFEAAQIVATAGVKLSENGQFENAAIAGSGRAAPGPSDREEDDFSIGCGRRYLEESGTFIPAVYEHFRNGADRSSWSSAVPEAVSGSEV